MRDRGYPPSVREIGDVVGLTSPSSVHAHLSTLQRLGYLRRDPTKPRAIEVCYDPLSGAHVERRPTRHVPIVGDVAAGTDVLAEENITEILPIPEDLTGDGDLFMLRVRGDSMIDVGIFDGDFVVVRSQPTAEERRDRRRRHSRRRSDREDLPPRRCHHHLLPSNERLSPMDVPRRRGHDLRAGRDRAPQTLILSGPECRRR